MLSKLARGGVGKALGKIATRVIPGAGVVSAGLSVVKGVSQRGRPTHSGTKPGLDFGDVSQFIKRALPGGAHGRKRVSMVDGRCPSGYHPCKDGQDCCKNRHVNPSNGRATARAVRRIRRAEKQYKKVFSILHKKPAGKILPKGRR
jgi:hypothetical protein